DDPEGQIDAVNEVLEEIGASSVPQILVLNKADALTAPARKRLQNLWPDAVLISARDGLGLGTLLEAITHALAKGLVTLTLSIPYDRGDLVAAAHRLGDVMAEKHDADGTILDVRLPEKAAKRFADFLIGG
ncbi:MAG: GTPase HflX, partial [Acidimicrobiia bacterium]